MSSIVAPFLNASERFGPELVEEVTVIYQNYVFKMRRKV